MRYIKKITEYQNEYDADGNVMSTTESNRVIEYRGPGMGQTWFMAHGWIEYAGSLPLSRLDIVDGVPVELPEQEVVPRDWQDKERFIGALYALVPADVIVAVMSDAETLKGAVAGMALLTTNAAPAGMIDLLDARVVQWLEPTGLTIEQVKHKMEQMA